MAPRKSSWLFLGGAVAIALAFGAGRAWSPPAVRSQLRQTMSRQPTPFTELYFTSPSSLPKLLPPGVPSRFEFTIVNHEQNTTTYHYVVVVSGDTPEAPQPVASGDVTLPVSAATSVSVAVIPAVLGVEYVVSVHLAERAETIHFATHS